MLAVVVSARRSRIPLASFPEFVWLLPERHALPFVLRLSSSGRGKQNQARF